MLTAESMTLGFDMYIKSLYSFFCLIIKIFFIKIINIWHMVHINIKLIKKELMKNFERKKIYIKVS